MKSLLLSTLLTTTLCLGAFASCVDHDSTPPSAGDALGIPKDDGSVFDPGLPGAKQAGSGGPQDSAPSQGAPTGAPDASFVGAGGASGGGSGGKPNGPVPEPTTFLLVGAGLLTAAAARRRRKQGSDGEEDGASPS